MDILIIGAGLSGITVARKFAENGKKALVLDKRDVIAGNVYDEKIDGITTHIYGPHIFHTDSEDVNSFMSSFWTLNKFTNLVEVEVGDTIVPLPFNFKSIEKIFPDKAERLIKEFSKLYKKDERISILTLLESDNEDVIEVANFVKENIFENYTSKMWGLPIDKIDKWVLGRVPVVMGYNGRYFSDKYEGLPTDGYTNTMKRMLDHKNITVKTGVNALDVLELKDGKVFYEGEELKVPVAYCGPLDELFNYEFGTLPYRSLNIKFETITTESFQPTAVVNQPAHPTQTRSVEYKKMTFEESRNTVISVELPGAYDANSEEFNERFYPIPNDESREAYSKYCDKLKDYKNFYPLGRLATYTYINMDKAIELALKFAGELLDESRSS